ncbi:MAG: glycosyltransferase family 39 protein, partial [Bacteroidia bacterium]
MPKSAHFLLRGFLFLLAAVLRFWDLPNLPLMHDELSAWSRLQYASFQELIELGVKPDGHPAGVQVFLWFWVKCFGDKPWVIKFPFILMGLGSLFFAYQIGKKWFSENTALLLVACMATQQFAISLGANVARPYASGLFLSLLMVWAWTNFIEKKGSLFITLSYLFASVLCLYNHHFTALFAGIVWLSGFYLTKDWKRFLLLALGMFVLYFPHLPIFMNQFQNKGLEWLGKPDIYFVKDYFGYIFHYSIYVEIFILILFSYSLYKNYQLNTNNSPTSENLTFSTLQKRSISLLWFFLPLLIGYAYSVLRAPLLQFSMLIFTYPFLLLFLFSYTEHFKKAEMNLAVFALISLNLLSLIYKRQHFDISYHQPHKAFYEYAARETPPQDSTLTYYSIRKEYVEYYAKQEKKDISARYLFKDVNNLREWEQQLQQMKQPHLVLGNMPYSFVKLANRYFPYLKEIEKGFTYEIYELSKKGTRNGM